MNFRKTFPMSSLNEKSHPRTHTTQPCPSHLGNTALCYIDVIPLPPPTTPLPRDHKPRPPSPLPVIRHCFTHPTHSAAIACPTAAIAAALPASSGLAPAESTTPTSCTAAASRCAVCRATSASCQLLVAAARVWRSFRSSASVSAASDACMAAFWRDDVSGDAWRAYR